MSNVGLEGTAGKVRTAAALARDYDTEASAPSVVLVAGNAALDELDLARAQEYALLGSLLLRAPDPDALARLSRLTGDASPLGLAHIRLAEAASNSSAPALHRDYFDLFLGIGRGDLLPYASFYLTGFLHDRPLVRLRDDLRRLGLERSDANSEPEDHIATLCEIMSGLVSGQFEAPRHEDRHFFRQHIAPWGERFFTDLIAARPDGFYGAVGGLGTVFMSIEAEAFCLES